MKNSALEFIRRLRHEKLERNKKEHERQKVLQDRLRNKSGCLFKALIL